MPYPVTLRQLHYFCVLAEELNFRRAAERLFISQPPLSRQIRILEDALGTPLFERCPAGPAYPVALTEAGARLLPMALQQLQHMDTMLQHFSGAGSDTPSGHPAPGSPPAAAGRASNAHHASASNHASGDKRASGRQHTSGNNHAGGQRAMNRRAISDNAPRPVLLRLGLTPVIDAAQFAWIKPVLATRMPHVRLDVLRQGSTQLVRNLLHGRLDAATSSTRVGWSSRQIITCCWGWWHPARALRSSPPPCAPHAARASHSGGWRKATNWPSMSCWPATRGVTTGTPGGFSIHCSNCCASRHHVASACHERASPS